MAQSFGVSAKKTAAFRGTAETKFKKAIEWAAKEVDINPGLLAANLIAERVRSTYLSGKPVDSFVVGVDDFHEKRHDIARKVPAYAKVKWNKRTLSKDINEQKREVTTIPFRSGPHALLASAVYLKHGEVVLRAAASAASADFDNLPVETRFFLVRRAFNAAHRRAKEELAKILVGKDLLVRDPKVKCRAKNRTKTIGRRCATIRTAQALHLSTEIFGVTPR
jgi:hypothetical protein